MTPYTAPFSPEDLTHVRIPNVEDRINEIEAALSLLTLVTRAVSQGQDLGLSSDTAAPGWALASELAERALQDLWTVQAALPTRDWFLKAEHRRLVPPTDAAEACGKAGAR